MQGKELSFNNRDTDAAFELVGEFDAPAIAIIKHANPCGVAVAGDLATAYRRALACDPVSAFGGIIAANRPLDGATAEEVVKIMSEVIIAQGADADARAVLAAKKICVCWSPTVFRTRGVAVRTLAGGLLVQDRDASRVTTADLKVVSERAPNAANRPTCCSRRIYRHVVERHHLCQGRHGGHRRRPDEPCRQRPYRRPQGRGRGRGGRRRDIGDGWLGGRLDALADGLMAAAAAGAAAVINQAGQFAMMR